MNSQQSIEQRLWEYIDGTSTIYESSAIEKLVAENEEWKNLYEEMLEIKQMLQASELEQPSMRFTKNVMEKISFHTNTVVANYINKKIIWAIGLFCMILISCLLIYAFSLVKWDWKSGSAINFYFEKVEVSKFFNSTYGYTFMMINVVLGLVLVDKFLARRRDEFGKEM